MKTELMKIPNRGLCIVISEFDCQEFIKALGGNVPTFAGGIFQDVYVIADEIRAGRKIGAIKEIRSQTGWGLKEAKEYCDKFVPYGRIGRGFEPENDSYADEFIRHHMPPDFIGDEDFEV